MSDKQNRAHAPKQQGSQEKEKNEGFTTHTYDTERAFFRMLKGDKDAQTEFNQLLDRDIEKRVKSLV